MPAHLTGIALPRSRLEYVEDVGGNRMSLEYGDGAASLLLRVNAPDGDGRWLEFDYNGLSLIIAVRLMQSGESEPLQQVRYGYDFTKLTQVTDNGGNTTHFDYARGEDPDNQGDDVGH